MSAVFFRLVLCWLFDTFLLFLIILSSLSCWLFCHIFEQMETMQSDLNSERSALQKMESAKLTLEKQVQFVRKLRKTIK